MSKTLIIFAHICHFFLDTHHICSRMLLASLTISVVVASQSSTNLIFVSTDFCAHKMDLHARSCTSNYVCIKQSLWMLNRFPYTFCHQLTLKSIRQGYAQHKGISYFNSTSTGELKIDQSRKLG